MFSYGATEHQLMAISDGPAKQAEHYTKAARRKLLAVLVTGQTQMLIGLEDAHGSLVELGTFGHSLQYYDRSRRV